MNNVGDFFFLEKEEIPLQIRYQTHQAVMMA